MERIGPDRDGELLREFYLFGISGKEAEIQSQAPLPLWCKDAHQQFQPKSGSHDPTRWDKWFSDGVG